MHNLHYIVIRADSGKEACDAVENEIVEWGSEDNWGQICGALSEKNIIYNTGVKLSVLISGYNSLTFSQNASCACWLSVFTIS